MKNKRFLFLCSSVFMCGRFSVGAAPTFLLPNDVAPSKHTVELTIDPSRETFDGRMRIDVELRKPVTEIWVNAKDLVIASASLNGTARTVLTAGGEFIGLGLGAPVQGSA